jgi:mannose-6-phosphate isomerase
MAWQHLRGVAQHYAWGSTTAIPNLIGSDCATDGRPVAEWWLGAHPSAPATIDGVGLDALISEDASRTLGSGVVERFGPSLPFLAKLLAADSPLSIQAHPSVEQAAAGFARENDAGVALSAATRVYRDPNHKPEIICALTEFEALCGFRPVPEMAAVLEGINAPTLVGMAARLRAEHPDQAIRSVLSSLLQVPVGDRARIVGGVVKRCERVVATGGRHGEAASLVLRLAELYPDDPGVVVALMLNHVVLRPGQALVLGPGNLHAYLRGFGIEVMANSDNVLRGGLTPKHVDVTELLHILDASVLADPIVEGHVEHGDTQGETVVWPVPFDDFSLVRHRVHGTLRVRLGGPSIVIVTDGAVDIGDGVRAERGSTWWVAADEPVTGSLTGTGTVYVASVGSGLARSSLS